MISTRKHGLRLRSGLIKRATNAAFRASIQPVPAVPEITTTEVLPPPQEMAEEPLATPQPQPQSPDVLNIKGMSADDIRELRKLFSTQEESHAVPANAKKVPTLKTPAAPPAPPTNRFQGLLVEEVSENVPAPPAITKTACERPPKQPQWERRLPKQPRIGAAEVGPRSLYLRVEVESIETQRKYGVRALVDSGATGLFIDREYVKSNQIPTTKLSVVVPVFNVDGSANTAGSISEVAELILRYKGPYFM